MKKTISNLSPQPWRLLCRACALPCEELLPRCSAIWQHCQHLPLQVCVFRPWGALVCSCCFLCERAFVGSFSCCLVSPRWVKLCGSTAGLGWVAFAGVCCNRVGVHWCCRLLRRTRFVCGTILVENVASNVRQSGTCAAKHGALPGFHRHTTLSPTLLLHTTLSLVVLGTRGVRAATNTLRANGVCRTPRSLSPCHSALPVTLASEREATPASFAIAPLFVFSVSIFHWCARSANGALTASGLAVKAGAAAAAVSARWRTRCVWARAVGNIRDVLFNRN